MPARRDLSLRRLDIEEVVAIVAVLVTEFQAVVPFQPAQRIEQLPDLRNLKLRPPRRRTEPRQAADIDRRNAGANWDRPVMPVKP